MRKSEATFLNRFNASRMLDLKEREISVSLRFLDWAAA